MNIRTNGLWNILIKMETAHLYVYVEEPGPRYYVVDDTITLADMQRAAKVSHA